jgi:hypothetical protein
MDVVVNQPAAVPKPSWVLMLNSRVILAGVVALLTILLAAIEFPILAGSAVGYLGAVVGVALLLPFAITVFLSVDRRNLRATRAATLICFGAAGLASFGVISNVSEALYYRQTIDPRFLGIFSGTGFGIAAYFTASGIAFRRWQRELEAASGSTRLSPGQ